MILFDLLMLSLCSTCFLDVSGTLNTPTGIQSLDSLFRPDQANPIFVVLILNTDHNEPFTAHPSPAVLNHRQSHITISSHDFKDLTQHNI